MAGRTDRLSFIEKAGYSLGDAAANFVFMTMILFQLNFYTDTMGITAAAAGTMLLLGRLWDAFFDPMMGVLADRTNTRWGKFRPWILWTAAPWGVVMVLAYTAPNFGTPAKVLYAYVTNVALMTLYSMNNTPYSALAGVMTADSTERTTLSSYRFVAAMIAQLVVGGFTLPLVPKADFKNLAKNGPWIAMFVLTLSHFVFVAMRGGTMFYYFSYYVDSTRLFEFLQRLGLPQATAASPDGGHYLMNTFGLILRADRSNVASVGFSLFNILSQFVTVIGVVCSALLTIRFGKRAVALAGFSLTTIFMAAFILLPAGSIEATYGLEIVRALAYAPTIPLIWAMFADVADYAEWTTGRRTTGVIFATILFALKTGLSLGGAIAGWLLAAYGYVPNVTQTAHALEGIRLTVSVYPAIFLAIAVVCLLSYRITRSMNTEISDELARRRRAQPDPSSLILHEAD